MTVTVLAYLATGLLGLWLLTFAAYVVPLVARAYGESWSDVMVDMRERLLDGYARQFNSRGRHLRLLRKASYLERIAIRARQAWKSVRRGRPLVAIDCGISLVFAACLGPLAGAVEAALLYPFGRVLAAWCDYIQHRHVEGRSVRYSLGAVAQTFEIVASLWSGVYIARELRSLRRAHAQARPTWTQARGAWLANVSKRQRRASVVILDPTPQPTAWLPPINNHRLN